MTFSNNSSQRERRQVIKDTYHNRYQDESGGRFAKVQPTNVSGKDPATLYPRQPANSYWAEPDPSGPTPPLNQDVNEMEPVGTAQEIEDSLKVFSWEKSRSSQQHEQFAESDRASRVESPAGPPHRPNTLSNEDVGDDGTAAAPASLGHVSSPTSLSEPRAVPEEGDGGIPPRGRQATPSPRFNIRRRLK